MVTRKLANLNHLEVNMADVKLTTKGFTDMMKAQRQKAREKSQLKKPNGRWYNGNSLLGNDWARFY